jgi:hypothetical protein
LAEELSIDDASRAGLEKFEARYGEAGVSSTTLRAETPVRVARLDQEGRGYFLVPIRDDAGLRGIVQIDAQTGEEESSARIQDPSSPFLLGDDVALDAARKARPQVRDWGRHYLGWRPCKESFNSLRPLWVVTHGDRAVYVDQTGRVFDELAISGRGG